jgi:adenosine/AMP kinase
LRGDTMELKTVKIKNPEELNIVIGQSHFIKTAEDIYEAMVNSVPNVKFGVAFCEASAERLVRVEGNDDDLKKLAAENAFAISAGHSFFLVMRDAFPVNVLGALKNVPEVCYIYCATANPVEVIVAENESGRGILGVIDGKLPVGIEDEKGEQWRKDFLRKIGYKR